MARRRALEGSLTIRRPRRRPGAEAAAQDLAPGGEAATEAAEADETEPYLTSLAKLFPAEALSALLLVLSVKPEYAMVRYGLIVVICLALIGMRFFATRNPETGMADWWAIGVSLTSFLIYAAALGAFGILFWTDVETTRLIATVVGILWLGVLTAAVRSTPPP